MIILKDLEIEESLVKQTKVNKTHQCAYCSGLIGHRTDAIKASFRYDRKLYPLYFHKFNKDHGPYFCFQLFKEDNRK